MPFFKAPIRIANGTPPNNNESNKENEFEHISKFNNTVINGKHNNTLENSQAIISKDPFRSCLEVSKYAVKIATTYNENGTKEILQTNEMTSTDKTYSFHTETETVQDEVIKNVPHEKFIKNIPKTTFESEIKIFSPKKAQNIPSLDNVSSHSINFHQNDEPVANAETGKQLSKQITRTMDDNQSIIYEDLIIKPASEKPHKISSKKKNEISEKKHDKMRNIKKGKIHKKTNKCNKINIMGSQEIPGMRSQNSTYSQLFYKMVLSQPPREISHKNRLLWLQKRRQVGIWVECCYSNCKKWRYIPDIHDPLELPNVWYCHMNKDESANECTKEEQKINIMEEEDLIHGKYTAGSLVWAHLEGYPWWPAMVDDCPDTEQYYWLDGFSDIPTYYNVTFFDSAEVTRSWMLPNNLKPYKIFGKRLRDQQNNIPDSFKSRIAVAKSQADDAYNLSITDRLKKYSFITRYTGKIKTPPSSDDDSTSGDDDIESVEDDSMSIQGETEESYVFNKNPPKIMNKKSLNASQKSPKDFFMNKEKHVENELSNTEYSNSIINMTEEIPIQQPIVINKGNLLLNSQSVISSSINSSYSQTLIIDFQSNTEMENTNNTEGVNVDSVDIASIQEEDCETTSPSDAVVPSTITAINEINFETDETSTQKTIEFNMF